MQQLWPENAKFGIFGKDLVEQNVFITLHM